MMGIPLEKTVTGIPQEKTVMGIPQEETVTGIPQAKTVMEILQKTVMGIPQENTVMGIPDGDSPEDGDGVYPGEDCDGDSPKYSSLEEERDELRRHSRRGIS